MPMKKDIFTYSGGMNEDISKSKLANNIYFNGRNIRVVTNKSFGSVTNQKGNSLQLTVPDIQNNPTNKNSLSTLNYPITNNNVLGHTQINKDLYLLTKSFDPSLIDCRFYYAQSQSSAPDPYIDSNLRVIVDDVIVFESFVDSNGVVEGPRLDVGKTVKFQSFYLASEPNEPAPAPTIYLDVYKNGVLVSRQSSFCGESNVTLTYTVETETNDVWYAHAYTLPQPGPINNPFEDIDLSLIRLEGEPFAIWKVTEDLQIELKFFDFIPVKTTKLDVEGFYENENNIKLYWADGDNELRFINIADPNSLNLDKKFLSTTPQVALNQPEIVNFAIGGTSHTSGTIQYAYNLYNLYGSQTRISPLSELAYLNNDDIGNQPDQIVSKSPVVQFKNLDLSYQYVRIYSIKYNNKNSTPKISLIYDRPIQKDITIIDDNNGVIQEIAFSEFIFLGGDTYIPEHIFSKDNHLFLANYKTKQYEVDFDARAYRYDKSGNTVITDTDGNNPITFNINNVKSVNIPPKFDSVNPTNKSIEGDADYNKYVWKSFSGQTIPGETINYYNYNLRAINQSEVYSISCVNYVDEFDKDKTVCIQNQEERNIIAKEGSVFFQSIEVQVTQNALFESRTADDIIISNGVIGGLGPNVGFEIKYRQTASNAGQPSMSSNVSLATVNKSSNYTSLKSGEIYRLYIEFLFNDGRFGYPKWIADVKIPEIGAELGKAPIEEDGTINYAYIETELINSPEDDRIIGWRTAIVERTESDKTVVTQGLYNPAIHDNFKPNVDYFPSYFQRTVRQTEDAPQTGNEFIKPVRFNTSDSVQLNLSGNSQSATDNDKKEITAPFDRYVVSRDYGNLYTPEAVIAKADLQLNGCRLRKLGFVKNTFSSSSVKYYDVDGLLTDDFDEIENEGSNISRNTLEEGATLLAQLIAPAVISNSAGKFISDNRLPAGDIFFTKKTFAYTRYFGGYSKVRDDFDFTNNLDFTSKLYKMGAIENIYPFVNPDTSTTINFATGADIPVIINDTAVPSVEFKSYSGSSIVIVGLSTLSNEYDLTGLANGDYGVMMEVYRVLQNQYGGDSYEVRQINRTIPYSKLELINTAKTVDHYGDTFIQKFNSLKTFKSENTEMYMTEIVSVPVETSINLDLRYDLLKYRPNNEEADELTSYGYNPVYDQKNNTIRGVPKPTNFNESFNFKTNVLPSKIKIPNESIDSFTDFLVNDAKVLDGKYGEITGIGEYKDNMYAFQRNAVAYLAINPRVQINTSDGIQTELGSGRLIERYQYVTTNSGTINKWSIVKTKNGLMYFDLLNKSINFIVEQELSTVKGIYNKIKDFSDTHYDKLKMDNIILNQGVHAHYDNINEDTYFTFLTENDKFTIAYNGIIQSFSSYYDFTPTYYIQHNNKLLSSINNTEFWEHDKGKHQTFYGIYYPSSITILANPEPFVNKIFNNIGFEAETYVNDVDVHDLTFNKMRVWNEYQDSGEINMLEGIRPNLKRKFRNWNIIIPRSNNSRDRINNPWAYIKLEFDKEDSNDYELVLHDMIISYMI